MYHIQIVGAGYTGLALARHFRSLKQKVWALSRTGKNNAELASCGAISLLVDVTRPETLTNIPPAHFTVISLAPDARDENSYREIYLQGVANYLSAIRKNPVPNLIVYLSSTGVYGEKGGAWVNESTPPEPDTVRGKILLEAEHQVLNSGFPAVIFRLGGIYGPGRNGGSGQVEHDTWSNRIHVEDICGAMPVIFNKGEAGSIYLGVEDEPVLKRGTGLPAGSPNLTPKGKRCSNARLKSLGYSFKFPS